MLSRVKVRSVTSPAAIPDLAQQIVGKCRLIHSSKVCSLPLPTVSAPAALDCPLITPATSRAGTTLHCCWHVP